MKNGTLKHISLEGSRVADEGLESTCLISRLFLSVGYGSELTCACLYTCYKLSVIHKTVSILRGNYWASGVTYLLVDTCRWFPGSVPG